MRAICGFLLAIVTCVLYMQPAFAAREVKSASYPDISADGQTVYFSCWGDIWSAPRDGSAPATRLTVNEAYDGRPLLSPDGKQIAFVSDRYGNLDVFVMPAEGGPATRLTWHSNTDYIYDWRADGKAILCYLTRQDLWGQCLYEVPLDGTAPQRISGPDHDEHVFGSYLGDTTHLIYTRGPGDWADKRYHGSGAYDLWSFNALTGEHQQLTSYDGEDLWPQPTPDGQFVFFVSDRDGTKNIWKLDMRTNQQTQVTHFHNDGPLWPRISSDGDELVFEVFGELWTVDTRGGEPQRVPITFADDTKEVMALEKDFRNNIGEYALSPNGRYFAVAVWGDIFLLKNPDEYKEGEEPDQDLSRTRALVTGPGREQHLEWHPDGKKLTYVSDRNGNYDVYILDLTTLKETQVTDTPADEAYPDFAPQGNKLAYYSGNRELRVRDLDTGEDFMVFEGIIKGGPWYLGYNWAPDGYWLAVEEQVADEGSAIKLVNIMDRQPHDISQTPDWMNSPVWSRDGKYLAYVWEHEDNTSDVMLLKLTTEEETYDTDLLFPEDQADAKAGGSAAKDRDDKAEAGGKPESADEDAKKAKDEGVDEDEEGAAEPGKDEKKEMPPLQIDFDHIHLRAKPITSMAGYASSPYFDPESKYIIFQTDHEGEQEWWSAEIEGDAQQRLTDGDKGSPQWAPDGSKLYFLDHNHVAYLDMDGALGKSGETVDMLSRVDYDQYGLWEQALHEAWRVIDTSFYDPTIGGSDWTAQLKRYLPRVRESATPDEFGNLIRQMLGETGKSHMGYYDYGSLPVAKREATASFGVLYDESYSGPGWKVAQVFRDSPATYMNSKLYPSDVIIAVDGAEITSATNEERVMDDKAGLPMKIKVRSGELAKQAWRAELQRQAAQGSKADSGKAAQETDPPAEREVVIKPYTVYETLDAWYESWVETNRQEVYKLSGNRIAYQHIREMEASSLAQFRRELFTETQGKDALIIDVRFNGGGWTAVDMFNLLDHKLTYTTKHRDSDIYYSARQLVFDGPIVVLTDAHSFSNAEIFSHIMQDLGKGVLIGEATPGGVISTYEFPLLTGTVRVPAWGDYCLNGKDMEGGGAIPDVPVDIDPQAVAQGRDNQIETAVQYLLDKLAEQK
jgi:tricorn protease